MEGNRVVSDFYVGVQEIRHVLDLYQKSCNNCCCLCLALPGGCWGLKSSLKAAYSNLEDGSVGSSLVKEDDLLENVSYSMDM